MPSTRRLALERKLAWMPRAWLACQEALRLSMHTCIADFALEDPHSLDLPTYLKDLEDVEYFSATYTSHPHLISLPHLHPKLLEADLLAQSCTRAVYTFWAIMHRVLSPDSELKSVRWMRRNPYPDFVTFAAGEKVAPGSHDYFLITYTDGQAFVVDLTARQFGWEGWLLSRREYEEILVSWRLEPEGVDVASEIAGLDRGDWRLKVTKDVVEKCFAEAEKCGDEQVWGRRRWL
jgi:hypothetical protein